LSFGFGYETNIAGIGEPLNFHIMARKHQAGKALYVDRYSQSHFGPIVLILFFIGVDVPY
jgi:hypothetical protein